MQLMIDTDSETIGNLLSIVKMLESVIEWRRVAPVATADQIPPNVQMVWQHGQPAVLASDVPPGATGTNHIPSSADVPSGTNFPLPPVAVTAPAAPVPSPPVVAATASTPSPVPPELDSAGLPWDARIHSETRAKNKDGTWRFRRNLDEQTKAVVLSDLRAAAAVPTPPSTAAGSVDSAVAPLAALAMTVPVSIAADIPLPPAGLFGSSAMPLPAELPHPGLFGSNTVPLPPPQDAPPSVAQLAQVTPPAAMPVPPTPSGADIAGDRSVPQPPVTPPAAMPVPSAAPVGVPNAAQPVVLSFADIITRVNQGFSKGTLTQPAVMEACKAAGLDSITALAKNPGKIPEVATKLGFV